MKKSTFPKLLLLIVMIVSFSTVSYAIPAYARQTGMACNACHFQHFPSLNAFGRMFKANGYTMVGAKNTQNLIAGDFLSLPAVLNAAVVSKFKYTKSNGTGDDASNRGEYVIPDEAALAMGGRIGENVGFYLEGQIGNSNAPFIASFKMPFSFQVKNTRLNIIPFFTDGLGAAFGMELMNTGAVRNMIVWENVYDTSAQQILGTNTSATGVTFAAFKDWGHASYTVYAPVYGTTDAGPFLSYIRAVATPTVGDWDLGLGTQIWAGRTVYTSNKVLDFITSKPVISGTKESTAAWVVDFQAQGSFGTKPFGFYATYGTAAKSDATIVSQNILNSSLTNDKKVMTFSTELGIIPEKVTIGASYKTFETGDVTNNKKNSYGLMASYKFNQNVSFQLNQSMGMGDYYDITRDNGKNLTSFILFASF